MTNSATPRVSAPYGTIDQDWFNQRVENDPWLYHVTSRNNLPAILEHGLLPPAAGITMASTGATGSNPEAIYLGGRDPMIEGWLHEWTGQHSLHAVNVAIDLRKIDPRRLIPDEDAMAGCIVPDGIDPTAFGVPAYGPQWASYGDWALDVRLGAQPGIVEATWEFRNTIAHLGPIPFDAIDVDVPLPRRLRDTSSGPLSDWVFNQPKFQAYRDHPWLECENASEAVLVLLAQHQIVGRIVEFSGHANDEHTTHCVVDAAGTVIDLTLGQFDPTAPWPLIEALEQYQQRFSTGPEPVALLERWADGCYDIEAVAAEWASHGITHT